MRREVILSRIFNYASKISEEIKRVELYHGTIKYKKPFVIATSVSVEEEVILVIVETSKATYGIGESILPEKLSENDRIRLVKEIINGFQEIIGKTPYDALNHYLSKISSKPNYIRVPFSLSLLDLIAKGNDIRFGELFGKLTSKKIFTDITIGIESLEETVSDVKKAIDAGFKAIKLKVGKRGRDDVKMIEKVWSILPEDTALRVDANQGWTLEDALYVLKEIEKKEIDIDFIEQPVPKDKVDWLKTIKQETPIPVIADESIRDTSEFEKIKDKVDGINLKLWKAGDPIEVFLLGKLARSYGLITMIGCAGETNLGITVDTYLASVISVDFADLDSDLLLEEKIPNKTQVKSSFRILPQRNGIGFSREDIPKEFHKVEVIE